VHLSDNLQERCLSACWPVTSDMNENLNQGKGTSVKHCKLKISQMRDTRPKLKGAHKRAWADEKHRPVSPCPKPMGTLLRSGLLDV
jgi:hypothetical protein